MITEEDNTELVKEHKRYYMEYKKIYPDKLCVLHQNGKFYEIYDGKVHYNTEFQDIRQLLLIHETNKKDMKGAIQAGFPLDPLDPDYVADRIDKLAEEGYVVVIINEIGCYVKYDRKVFELYYDEDGYPDSVYYTDKKGRKGNVTDEYLDKIKEYLSSGKKQDRKIRGFSHIITKANMRTKNTSHHKPQTMVTLYVYATKKKGQQMIECNVGLSAYESATKRIITHQYKTEFHQSLHESQTHRAILDGANMFILAHNACEVLIHMRNTTSHRLLQLSNVKKTFSDCDTMIREFFDQDFKKIDQRTLQSNLRYHIVSECNIPYESLENKTPMEYLGFTPEQHYAAMSYFMVRTYIKQTSANPTRFIKPEIYNDETHMMLYDNAIDQLNLVETKYNSNENKYDSILKCVNYTITPMGARALRSTIVQPMYNTNDITNQFDMTREMADIHKTTFKTLFFESCDNISDLEILHAMLGSGKIEPLHLHQLWKSWETVILIREYVLEHFPEGSAIRNMTLQELGSEDMEQYEHLIEYMNKTWDQDRLQNCRIKHIADKFDIPYKYILDTFQREQPQKTPKEITRDMYYEKLYKTANDLHDSETLMRKTQAYFRKLFADATGKPQKQVIEDKKTPIIIRIVKKVHVLELSNTAYNAIIKQSSNKNVFQNYSKVNPAPAAKKRFNTPEIIEASEKILKGYEEIREYITRVFKHDIVRLFNTYETILHKMSKFICKLDLIYSNCALMAEHSYICPIVHPNDTQSWISAKGIWHPIVRLISDIDYIPNDLELSEKKHRGLFIFGINMSGKSTYIKSCAVALVLAQAGICVPAAHFEFVPYKTVYTRISSQDNMMKGTSSFEVEVKELCSILKDKNPGNILAIGDELCRGTESKSAEALTCSIAHYLTIRKVSFVFTTHIHKVSEFIDDNFHHNEIGKYHLEFVEKNNHYEYRRKLKEGSGTQEYGIEVARMIGIPEDIIDFAMNLREKINQRENGVVQEDQSKYNIGGTSRYNSNVIKNDMCEMCNKFYPAHLMQIHHIREQHLADENDVIHHTNIGSINMNLAANQARLCVYCHTKVTNGYIVTSGRIRTTESPEGKLVWREKSEEEFEIDRKLKKLQKLERQLKDIEEVEEFKKNVKKRKKRKL